MERRFSLYEKIKNTKLNKLTVKQGDANVKLNLKKDLIDPNVEISEKVLEMLEGYAEKNIKQTEETTASASSDPESQSPTKRVRFDLEPKINEITSFSLIPNAEPIKPQENPTEEFLESSDSTSVRQETEESKDSKKEFCCRLCKLKFSNEKALHEHVSRIHGGKGAFNQNFLSKLKGDSFGDEDHDESSDIEDFDSQDDAYMSSSSDYSTKKQVSNKKSIRSLVPRPNVAIRVAKVAYYNSKGSVNSLNAFKSNIFKNGGIRGNFFSQERLPLRSCKIKMKITSSLPKENEAIEDFLINSHEISKMEYIDLNKTLSFQSSTIANSSQTNTAEELLVKECEIRNFFKSLLDYIPISNVTRLEDLIKSNQIYLTTLKTDESDNLNECLRIMHETVLSSKQFGITLYDLKKEINKKLASENFRILKMNLIKKLLDLLLKNHLILAVGVVERVYVAHEFKQHWVIESVKNQKGRGYFEDVELEEEEDLNDENQEQLKGEEARPKRQIPIKEDAKNSRNFKPVCLIPRPWRYIDGLLNRPVLKKMLESAILYLKTNPNSSFNTIGSHFCPALQPIMTLELLEMLEKLKCVKKIMLKKESSCDLFSDFNNGSFQVTDEDELEGNEFFTYYLTQSSIFNIKKIFPN